MSYQPIRSSFSTLSYYKLALQEQKPNTQNQPRSPSRIYNKSYSPKTINRRVIKRRANTASYNSPVKTTVEEKQSTGKEQYPGKMSENLLKPTLCRIQRPLNDTTNNLKQEIEQLNNQLKLKEEIIEKLKEQLKEVRKSKEDEIQELQDEIEKLSNQTTLNKGYQQDLLKENELLQNQLTQSNNELQNSRNYLAQLSDLLINSLTAILKQQCFSLEVSIETEYELEDDFRHRAVDDISEQIKSILLEIQSQTSSDLTNQINHLEQWKAGANSRMNLSQANSSILRNSSYTSQAGSFLYISDDDIISEFDKVEQDFAFTLYDFFGEREGDLQFKAGELIKVLERNKNGWWKGVLHDKTGVFPSNFVQIVNR